MPRWILLPKTTKEIIISNVFTYFNLIFLDDCQSLLLLVGAFRDLTFLPVIICEHSDWYYSGDPFQERHWTS